jgi:hypothetical protein
VGVGALGASLASSGVWVGAISLHHLQPLKGVQLHWNGFLFMLTAFLLYICKNLQP